MKIQNTIYIFFLLCFNLQLSAQTRVQVVTKEEKIDFDWAIGKELIITGERAEIKVTGHSENVVTGTVQLISKHPELSQAKKEIEYHQLVTERIGKKVYLRNYIELPNTGEKPEGNLKAIYEIKVPAKCAMTIKNYFGKIDLVGVAGEIVIESDFSKVNLQKTSGEIEIATKFGDITAEGINGQLSVISNRGDLFLSNIKGDYNLDVSTAEVHVTKTFFPDQFMLTTKKSNVRFQIENLSNTRFEFESENTQFQHPQWMKFTNEELKKGKQMMTSHQKSTGPRAQLNMQFGKFEILEQVGSH